MKRIVVQSFRRTQEIIFWQKIRSKRFAAYILKLGQDEDLAMADLTSSEEYEIVV